MVTAPGGTIALNKRPSFWDSFESEAYAAIAGLGPVPDGTIVQLARFSANGTGFSVITTTTISGGRYSFNLAGLGLQPATDLIVRVAGSNGREMRAFVVGTAADISPVSEATCQLVIQALGDGLLSNYTLQEVSDITGAVGSIALSQNIGNAVTVAEVVALVKSAVDSNSSVMSFIANAAKGGESTQGTSDVGNFFPFEQGNIWRYRGRTSSLLGVTNYDTTVLVSGQGPSPISGINSTIFFETNSQGANREGRHYDVKGPTGVVSHGSDDPNDSLTRQLVPYQSVRFPLTPGTSIVLLERTGLNWGNDEDGDGRNEMFSFKLFQNVLTMEPLTVPAGTFIDSLHIEFKAVFVVSFTRGGQATLTQTNSDWHAPGVGKVKEVISVQIDGGTSETVLTEELEGYVVNGYGSGLRIEVKPSSVSMRVGEENTLQATAFDMSNNQVVGLPYMWLSSDPSIATVRQDGTLLGIGKGTATVTALLGALKSNSVPVTVSDVKVLQLATNDLAYDNVSRKLYASVPGTHGRIATIDPVTGSVSQSAVVGDEPDRLAISDDGQFLYVSIDNENAVRRLTLPALTADLTVPLANMAPVTHPGEFLCGKDMKVVPGNARTVVVAIARHPIASGSCAFNEPDGAAVYEDGTMLPNTMTGSSSVHRLEFSNSPSLLFGLGTFSPGSLSRLSLTASGLSLIDSNRLTNWPGRDFKFLDDVVYTASGDVISATTYSVVGSFTNTGAYSIRPDGNSKQLFAVTVAGTYDSVATIQAFDLNTLTLKSALDIPNLGIPVMAQYPRFTSLVRWGTDGLAFRTSSNEVVIVRSPLVSP
ncbi:hypothetical protein W02_08870 [Nitrospira sp. KM1]|nr:hypothetical protein W02_08870 [Nitrospira sp. KM1]